MLILYIVSRENFIALKTRLKYFQLPCWLSYDHVEE